MARCTEPGVAQVVVELAPKELELSPEKVVEYMHEIGGEETIGRVWSSMPEPKRWRERYTKHAKTFVHFGSDAGGKAAAAGMSLEIVPEADPTSLRAGSTLPIVLLDHGKPLPAAKVGLVAAGAADAFVTTDESGRAQVYLGRSGNWLLRFTQLRRSSIKDLEWESDFTTLTLEVLPAK